MSDKSLSAALEKLCKWRKFFASWQLGARPADDGEYKAVTDQRELCILMRAQLSALTGLLVRKGVFTQHEFEVALEEEAWQLDRDYEKTYPGFRTSASGLHMKLPDALETMRRMGFPP